MPRGKPMRVEDRTELVGHLDGYLYAGFAVDPPRHAPLVLPSEARRKAITRITALARRFDELPQVVKATVFRAVFMPPIKGAPRFDVVLLIRTTSLEAIADVQAAEPYAQLAADSVITAYNSRRIGATEPFAPDVTEAGAAAFASGSYLFNHFTATDPDQATAAWESLTGWYPPHGPPRFLANQLLRPSFTTFVRATLREHGMAALPVFFTPVSDAA